MADTVHQMAESTDVTKLPPPFVMRRLHSLLGLWLVIYLFEHLLVNSQAALFFQDDGSSFVRMVNKIHALPFLKVIEVLLLGVPFLVHGLWGIRYALTSKSNSFKSKGNKPSLPEYRRNRAFTWQRITSWILLIGVIAHVVQIRFLNYPTLIHDGQESHYLLVVREDPALLLTSAKLHATTFTQKELFAYASNLEKDRENLKNLPQDSSYYVALNRYQEQMEWLLAAQKKKLRAGDILIDAPDAGSAFFIIVRETFKGPLMVILYTVFVLAACYHGFNGLWTFLITWGVIMTRRSQNRMKMISSVLMWIVMIFGLMAIWGTYWTFQLGRA